MVEDHEPDVVVHDGDLDRGGDLGLLGTWCWDAAADRMIADPDIAALFGVGSGSLGLSASRYDARVHPDDRSWLARERRRCYGQSGYGVLEYRIIDPVGAIRWVMERAIYETDAGGALVRVRGLMIETTAIRQDGNTTRAAPAPMVRPLQGVVDAALDAHAAALQLGDATLIECVEKILIAAGGMLSQQLLGDGRRTQ